MTEVQSSPAIPSAFTFVESSQDIECYRLEDNGLRVLLLPQDGAPVATSMVTYHVGSRNERTGHTGATHMLEHLMFKGTERFHKRKGTSIFETLQRVGAEVNASTWVDRTNYYEMLPTEHLPLALDIEADRMRGALLDPQDVESERTVILNERDRNQKPDRGLEADVVDRHTGENCETDANHVGRNRLSGEIPPEPRLARFAQRHTGRRRMSPEVGVGRMRYIRRVRRWTWLCYTVHRSRRRGAVWRPYQRGTASSRSDAGCDGGTADSRR